jgi:uncharacterized protein YqjF (DUF2071 family)
MDELARSETYRQWAPARRYDGGQKEQDVTFLHYRIDDVGALRAIVPDQLQLATYDGSSWVTLIVLDVADVHVGRRRLPRWLGSFPEVDLAVHVQCDGRRGLYFLSIESGRRWAWILRRFAGLPYLYSALRICADRDSIRVRCGPRWVRGGPAAQLDLTVTPRHDRAPEPLAQFLADEFSAFVVDKRGRLCELDEVHAPWTLVGADVEIATNTLGDAAGVALPAHPELVGYSPGRSILTWMPHPVSTQREGLAPRNAPST